MTPGRSLVDNEPLAFVAAEAAFLIFFTIVLLLVPRQAVFLRLTSVFALAVPTFILQSTVFQLSNYPYRRTLVVAISLIRLLSVSEFICISRVTLKPDRSNRITETTKTNITRAAQAVGLAWNFRRIRTPWQAKNIPIMSFHGRTRFLVMRLIIIFFAYIIIDIMLSAPPPNPTLVKPGKETLVNIGRLSLEDIRFRIIGTFSFWLMVCTGNLMMYDSIATLPWVLIGVISPEDCPPLHGSVREAYTIRRFWGNFWHQWLRCGLVGHADVIVNALLPFRQSALLSRYTRLLIAFLISGLIHHVADLALGIPGAEAGSLVSFPLQALGIMVEDAVQNLARSCLPSSLQHSRVWRVVGYVWVASFLVWSTPPYFYPQIRLAPDPNSLIPVRLFRPLTEQLKHLW